MRFSLVGFILIIAAAIFSIQKSQSPVISPVPDTPPSSPLTVLFPRKKNPDELQKKIVSLIGNTWKNYSVYVKDYSSDFTVGINESVIFTAASVNKIPILASLYVRVQKKQIDLDTPITLQASDIQDYGTGTIRYDPPGTSYSVKTLARLMMQKSDNTAAFLLANYVIGVDAIQSELTAWGLTQTDMTDNKTSNKDMERMLAKIYTGGIANTALTQEMLAFMKDSDFEDRIPILLPKDVTVYHKTGDEDGAVHDVGIIEYKEKKYYLGVFTSDIADEDQAKKLIGTISKTVYDFLK